MLMVVSAAHHRPALGQTHQPSSISAKGVLIRNHKTVAIHQTERILSAAGLELRVLDTYPNHSTKQLIWRLTKNGDLVSAEFHLRQGRLSFNKVAKPFGANLEIFESGNSLGGSRLIHLPLPISYKSAGWFSVHKPRVGETAVNYEFDIYSEKFRFDEVRYVGEARMKFHGKTVTTYKTSGRYETNWVDAEGMPIKTVFTDGESYERK